MVMAEKATWAIPMLATSRTRRGALNKGCTNCRSMSAANSAPNSSARARART